MRNFALFLIRIYQAVVSPVLGPVCRFHPTCSSYAFGVIQKYGLTMGSFLALKRILRCHPLNKGGYDPIP